MTEAELIALEAAAVQSVVPGFSADRKKRLLVKMREYSRLHRNQPLPNQVPANDPWVRLQLECRAKDLAQVSDPGGFYLPPAKRRKRKWN